MYHREMSDNSAGADIIRPQPRGIGSVGINRKHPFIPQGPTPSAARNVTLFEMYV